MKIGAFILPALAIGGFGFAVFAAKTVLADRPQVPPPSVPASSPYAETLAGAGVLEPESETISVAPERPGVAVAVLVVPGKKVDAGDVLFRQDERALKAERAALVAQKGIAEAARLARAARKDVAAAKVLAAEAQLAKLRQAPRAEDLPPLEARVRESDANLKTTIDRLGRLEAMVKDGAWNEEDLTAARHAVEAGKAQLDRARADLALANAGTWAPDLATAEAEVATVKADVKAAEADVASATAEIAAAEAAIARVDTDLERLVVRAPISGTVLQVNVRVGEFVAAPSERAPILLGDIDPLHVRVDLDENDASRFKPGSPAHAFVRGHQQEADTITLEYVRLEPLVVPKKALTGSVVERVDTRVLQAIYRVTKSPGHLLLHCGQQVEVFVDAGAAVARAR